MATVTVQVQWPEGLRTLPPGARARVTVEDVTRVDESAVVLGETWLADLDPGRSPVAEVEVGEVDPNADVSVRVHVTVGVRELGTEPEVEVGDLVSTRSHPVLTRGRGTSVVVPVRVVGT